MSIEPIGSAEVNSGGVQVIARVGQIFRALDGEPWGLTLSQLANRLKLPRSTVHRLVGALAAEGLLMNATVAGRVCIGSEFVRIATASRGELRDQVAPLMRRVNEATGETVDCGILDGDQVRVIHVVETHHQLRAVSDIGAVFPLYCTAKGKAILAELDDETVRTLVPKKFEVFTENTLKNKNELLIELAEIRETGLAYDREEHDSGISTVAIAAKDPFGSVFALSVPVPTQRFALERDEIVQALLNISAELKNEFSPS
ncbi:MAG: IclR family transcriptional regulator [Acidimicrobiales bacterium]|jgi:DNA-binding IclR family transcriptional regulator